MTTAASAIADNAALYRAMFELNPAIKLLIDPREGWIVDANPAAVAFYGWSVDELRSMRIWDINTMQRADVAARLEETRSGKRLRFAFQHRTASGLLKDVEVFTGPLSDGSRELVFSIIHDVTERRQLQTRMAQAQKFEAIGQLAGTVAHDFNNLLSVVLGYADILGELLPVDGTHTRPLAELTRAASQAKALTRKLLSFSRRQPVEQRPFDLAALTAELQPVLDRLLGPDILLSCHLPAPAVVFGNAAEWEQVVLNLLMNARDAMPSGGAIRISVEHVGLAHDPQLSDGEWVELAVSDTGSGMNVDTQAKAFDPFFTTKPAGAGTGLGLATVYNAALHAGGTARIESVLGEGTTVRVLLPPDATGR